MLNQIRYIPMPHIIIEHSSDINSNKIVEIEKTIQSLMPNIEGGNLDPNQCKARSFSFNEYLVGMSDQLNSSFLHITIKILTGRSIEIRQKLSEEVFVSVQKLLEASLAKTSTRCDISVDIVEMDRNIYKKIQK